MHGSIDTSSALASGVPLVIRQAAFIPQGRSERRVMTCLGRRRDGGQRDIELWEAPLSKRKSQSCCGRRPDHDGTLGFDKGAREPRIHTTRSAVNRPHTICQKIWHLIGAGPAEDPHFFALAVPANHRVGPCGPGGAPHGPREYGRSRRSVGRNPR